MAELKSRFQGQRLVSSEFSFLKYMLHLSNVDLELAATKLQQTYSSDIGPDFVSEVRSFRREFSKELETTKTVLDILKLIMSSHITSSIPELATACVLFATLPVTVASAERSFSKLKIIKTYLRSTISQDRLDGLALLAIENECAKQLNIDDLIDTFANSKARIVKFMK
jgi:hypothetical protein